MVFFVVSGEKPNKIFVALKVILSFGAFYRMQLV